MRDAEETLGWNLEVERSSLSDPRPAFFATYQIFPVIR
jgi:hypothetical protein